MKLSSRQLAHLAAIGELGSFSNAAESLGLSQPALTKSIQLLERRVGAPLVRRTGRGAELTSLGLTLAVHGSSILASERRASADVDDWRETRRGRLFVGAPPAVSAYLMSPIISHFLATRPDVYVKLLVSPLDTLSFKLASNVVDLYVGGILMGDHPPGVTAHPLYDDELTIFVREGHPLLNRTNVSVQTLAKHSWVVLPPDKFFRRMSDGALFGAGMSSIKIALETDSFDVQLNVVRETDMLCMLPRKMLRQPLGLVDFQRAASLITGRGFTVGLFHKSENETSSIASAFISNVKQLLPAIVGSQPQRG